MNRTDSVSEEELHAWLDGELPAARAAIVGSFVRNNPAIARRLAAYRTDGDAIRRIFDRVDLVSYRTTRTRQPHIALRRAAMIGLIVATSAGGWMLRGWQAAGHTGVAQEAAIAHALYSGGPSARVDASDRTRVAEALKGVLGTGTALPEMSDIGYQLRAVQLLPVFDQTALQLIYSGGDQTVTVYLEKKPGAVATTLNFSRHGNITTASWDLDNMTCAISGAVDRQILETFAHRLYGALDKT